MLIASLILHYCVFILIKTIAINKKITISEQLFSIPFKWFFFAFWGQVAAEIEEMFECMCVCMYVKTFLVLFPVYLQFFKNNNNNNKRLQDGDETIFYSQFFSWP